MTKKQVSHFPLNDNSNGWSRILPPRMPKAPLADRQTAVWVVVGGGYAGLAAARRLAENRPDDEIILLEAGEIVENASGRNSGFAIDLPPGLGVVECAQRGLSVTPPQNREPVFAHPVSMMHAVIDVRR